MLKKYIFTFLYVSFTLRNYEKKTKLFLASEFHCYVSKKLNGGRAGVTCVAFKAYSKAIEDQQGRILRYRNFEEDPLNRIISPPTNIR